MFFPESPAELSDSADLYKTRPPGGGGGPCVKFSSCGGRAAKTQRRSGGDAADRRPRRPALSPGSLLRILTRPNLHFGPRSSGVGGPAHGSGQRKPRMVRGRVAATSETSGAATKTARRAPRWGSGLWRSVAWRAAHALRSGKCQRKTHKMTLFRAPVCRKVYHNVAK